MGVLSRVSGSVRILLSGDPSGLPDYVRRMAEPGDCGLFGPESVAWRVHASAATLIGGARARDDGFAIKGKTAVRIIHPKRRRVDGLNLGASGAP